MQHSHIEIYGSGHPNLDRDHEILIGILGELRAPDHDSSTVALLSTQLLAYLDAHFEHEESLMDRYDYPGMAGHKEAHAEMRAHTESVLRSCPAPGTKVELLVASLEEWVIAHMRGVDRDFAAFLKLQDVEKVGAHTGAFSDPD